MKQLRDWGFSVKDLSKEELDVLISKLQQLKNEGGGSREEKTPIKRRLALASVAVGALGLATGAKATPDPVSAGALTKISGQIAIFIKHTKEYVDTWNKYVKSFNDFMNTAEQTKNAVEAIIDPDRNPVVQQIKQIQAYVKDFVRGDSRDIWSVRLTQFNLESQALVRYLKTVSRSLRTIEDNAYKLFKEKESRSNISKKEFLKGADGLLKTRKAVKERIEITALEARALNLQQKSKEMWEKIQKENPKDGDRIYGQLVKPLEVELLALQAQIAAKSMNWNIEYYFQTTQESYIPEPEEFPTPRELAHKMASGAYHKNG